MDKIREFVKEVYSRTDDLISADELENQTEETMQQIASGDWTAIYSEIKRDFWLSMLEKLVGFQRYGVK